jgi:hypothetical protein
MSNGWTPERWQQQAAAIRRWKPWQQSTGPRTDVGKARSSTNAFRGGERQRFCQLAMALRAALGNHRKMLQQLSL